MANSFAIRSDNVALGRKLRAAVGKYPRGIAAGINRVAAGALTLSVREIQKDTGATAQKTIRRNMSVKLATTQSPEAKLIAFSAKIDRIPIYELRPRPRNVTKRRPVGGVSYGPAQKLLPGSFIARMKSTHIGVFTRIGIPSRKDPDVEAIAEAHGPSVALVFTRRKIMAAVAAYIKEKLPVELNRALAHVR